MSLWTVYDNPRDRPGMFIARRWDIWPGEKEPYAALDFFEAKTLEELRTMIPPGLHRLPRNPRDEPHIVESWM